MVYFIAVIIIAMSISFLCSLLEASSLSLSLTDIANLSIKKPAIAVIWKSFKKQIEKPIAVILILNTLAHTIGASLAGAQFDRLFGAEYIGIFSLVFSLMMIQWTELLPKSLGVRHNKKIAILSAVPLKVLTILLNPLIRMSNFINHPFSGKKKIQAEMDAIEDISVLARFATLNNLLSKDQEEILTRTMQLSKLKVQDIMIGREDIKYLTSDMSLMNALLYAHVHHHTRFPLIKDQNLDEIMGYVNFKDIVSALQINPKNPSLKGISRPIITVSEDEPFLSVLNKLTRGSQHIAAVKNNKDQVLGILTLEDVIESIIGDVNDEYDILPVHFYQITENRYLVGGGMRMYDLEPLLNTPVPDKQLTLSEWLLSTHGKMPKIEERIVINDIIFIIRKTRRSSVAEAIIETPMPDQLNREQSS